LSRPPQDTTDPVPQRDTDAKAAQAIRTLKDTLQRLLPYDGDVDAYAMALRAALSVFHPHATVLQVEMATLRNAAAPSPSSEVTRE
jgi:hypothetical protein